MSRIAISDTSSRLLYAKWHRAALRSFWALIAVAAMSLMIPIAVAQVMGGVSALAHPADIDGLRTDCLALEKTIDSLVVASRSHRAIRGRMARSPYSPIEDFTASGLNLAEYSLLPRSGRTSGTVDRWRLIATGPAAAWGALLSRLDDPDAPACLESGNWSAQGLTDPHTRGDMVLIVHAQDSL